MSVARMDETRKGKRCKHACALGPPGSSLALVRHLMGVRDRNLSCFAELFLNGNVGPGCRLCRFCWKSCQRHHLRLAVPGLA